MRTLLTSLLKSKDRGITVTVVEKMMSMLGIEPLTWKMIRDAKNFPTKLERLRNQERKEGEAAERKRIAHAERTLWLATKPSAPTTLKVVIRHGLTEVDIKKGITGEWNKNRNRGNNNQEYKRRIPMIRWKRNPPLWEAK